MRFIQWCISLSDGFLVHGDLTTVLDLVLQTTGTWMRVGNFGISYFMSSVEKCLIAAVSALWLRIQNLKRASPLTMSLKFARIIIKYPFPDAFLMLWIKKWNAKKRGKQAFFGHFEKNSRLKKKLNGIFWKTQAFSRKTQDFANSTWWYYLRSIESYYTHITKMKQFFPLNFWVVSFSTQV